MMGVMGELIQTARARLARRQEKKPVVAAGPWWVAELPDGRVVMAAGATRSEARADAKRVLGLKRLPPLTRLAPKK